MSRRRTIVCGVGGSPGRTAVHVAALLANQFEARVIAVHVLDRSTTVRDGGASCGIDSVYKLLTRARGARRGRRSRGASGGFAARSGDDGHSRRCQSRVVRTFVRASCAAEPAKVTNAPGWLSPRNGLRRTSRSEAAAAGARRDARVASEPARPR